jgi:DNA-binding IclR family transcriptional regulator
LIEAAKNRRFPVIQAAFLRHGLFPKRVRRRKSFQIDEFQFRLYGNLRACYGVATLTELVKSAARAFEILECFGKERAPLRLKELVERLGYPTSSVAALLKSMTSQGFLTFDSKSKCYMPSARLAGLVSWVPMERFEQGVVLNAMINIQRKTQELIVLGVEKGIYIEYVETIRSTEGMQLYIAPGTQRLTVQSVMGWHFLSTYADEHAHEIYRATIKRGELAKSEFSLDQLMRRVRRHRELDISFIAARDLVRPAAHWGSGMVTMMVPIPAGHRKLGIGVGGPAERLAQKLDLISECLRLEATEIARHVAESDAAAR